MKNDVLAALQQLKKRTVGTGKGKASPLDHD